MARMIDLKITFTAYVSVVKAPISGRETDGRHEEKLKRVMERVEVCMSESIEEVIRENGGVFHAAKSEYEAEN